MYRRQVVAGVNCKIYRSTTHANKHTNQQKLTETKPKEIKNNKRKSLTFFCKLSATSSCEVVTRKNETTIFSWPWCLRRQTKYWGSRLTIDDKREQLISVDKVCVDVEVVETVKNVYFLQAPWKNREVKIVSCEVKNENMWERRKHSKRQRSLCSVEYCQAPYAKKCNLKSTNG